MTSRKVYWLLVSAIWGTIKLYKTKDTNGTDEIDWTEDGTENDWTFGQVLPVFLLIGPVAVAVKGMFDQQPGDTHSATFELSAPRDQNIAEGDEMGIIDFNHNNLDTSRFRQDILNCTRRDYYDIATCPWIIPLVIFICAQVLEVTILMFFQIVSPHIKSTGAFGSVSYLAFLAFPSATYMIIFAYLVFEYHGPPRYHNAYFVTVFFIILGLYSMYPVWRDTKATLYDGSIRKFEDQPFMMSTSIVIFSMAFLSFVLPAVFISNR